MIIKDFVFKISPDDRIMYFPYFEIWETYFINPNNWKKPQTLTHFFFYFNDCLAG